MRLPQSSGLPLSFRVFSVTILIACASVLLPSGAWASTKQLVCSPTSLRFGNVAIGQSESQLVALTNTGQASVVISGLSESNSEFSISGISLPVNLGPGQSVNLNVIFTPTGDGWASGNLTFTSNASNPTLQLQNEGTGLTSVPLTAAPLSLSFGQVAVGTAATRSVVLTNARSWKETLKSFQTVGSDFSVGGPSFPVVLSPGQSVTLSVSFSPQTAGAVGGSVFIFGTGLNIPFAGTGTTTGQLTVSPTALNFGNVNVGTTTTQPSSMSATGGNVTISSANDSNSQFSFTGLSFPLTIAAGHSVGFDVVFSPTKSGTASGALTFTSNASNAQTSESVTGTGILPKHSVNLSWNPSSPNVVGYNVYRGAAVGAYSKINTALDPNTAYTDSTVISGSTYYYAATAVDSTGQESTYSTPIQVAIP